MPFGTALQLIINGTKIARAGWNGKGMFLFYVPSGTLDMGSIFRGDSNPYIAMKTAQNTAVPWLASQTDLLATDWEIVI